MYGKDYPESKKIIVLILSLNKLCLVQAIKIRCSSERFMEIYEVQNMYPIWRCFRVVLAFLMMQEPFQMIVYSKFHPLGMGCRKLLSSPGLYHIAAQFCFLVCIFLESLEWVEMLVPSNNERQSLPAPLAFCFPRPPWKHSQINANFKRGLLRHTHCCDIVSMSLLSSYLAVFCEKCGSLYTYLWRSKW